MDARINLKEIERKAFRSTFQDGLWDMYWGLLVICMALFMYRPATGYSPVNIILCMLMFALAYGLFTAGKRYLTLPRMGRVRFGEIRKRKSRTLAIMMGLFVLFTASLVVITSMVGRLAALGLDLPLHLLEGDSSLFLVAGLAGFIVGGSTACWSFFSDFLRGYYIAALMTLAVFLMILLNQPVYPIIIGILIFIPGLVLLIRFLKAYPLVSKDLHHE